MSPSASFSAFNVALMFACLFQDNVGHSLKLQLISGSQESMKLAPYHIPYFSWSKPLICSSSTLTILQDHLYLLSNNWSFICLDHWQQPWYKIITIIVVVVVILYLLHNQVHLNYPHNHLVHHTSRGLQCICHLNIWILWDHMLCFDLRKKNNNWTSAHLSLQVSLWSFNNQTS